MITDRLRLALELLAPSDWNKFERVASAFLASEFDNLRTIASPLGDWGRDSELYSPVSEPRVVLQYSVSGDWKGKIRRTVTRIQETFPEAIVLVYMSNKVIGAAADKIKRELRESHGLSLDVRDRSWFVERVSHSTSKERAAEELAQCIVDPYLESKGVTSYTPSDLSSPEAIAAVTFLGLQWKDDIREKGLTKLAFEAIVRATLASTDSQNRMSRKTIHERVSTIVPGYLPQQLNSALRRLTKRAIRHWSKEDEFCLTHDERQRELEFKTEATLSEIKLGEAIEKISDPILSGIAISPDQKSAFIRCIRTATNGVLLERSQSFAMAVQTGSLSRLASADFTDVLIAELSRSSFDKGLGIDWLSLLETCVREILLSEDPAVQVYMRSLADAFTLFAFLRQTPDVQGAVEKMFSSGKIWLDTSVILPLIAEPLFDGEPPGRFTRMFGAAREAGLELFVTQGVVEEIERHMNRALACARTGAGRWIGWLPYLFSEFQASGRSSASFHSWLENFRGEERPVQDISDYLKDEFGIETRNLHEERDAADPDLRNALQSLWYEAHRRRREGQAVPVDSSTITRLVEHDVECYCGVIKLRDRQGSSPFGYTAWWLTVDRQAFDLKNKLRDVMTGEPPDSPVLSADFMVNYLAVGPVRRKIGKSSEANLPLIMDLGRAEKFTPEILAEAENLRQELHELPDRVVRRKVRDYLDRARRHIGPIAMAGVGDLDDELMM